jgi:hypothetical protein
VCIACIERWVPGRVLITKTTISVAPAGWVGSAEVWFARTEPTDSWRQQRILLGEEVIRLQMMDAKSREAAGGKRSKSAAEAALNRGRQTGQIPRKPPQPVSSFCRDLFTVGQRFAGGCVQASTFHVQARISQNAYSLSREDRVSSLQAISSDVRFSRLISLAKSELLLAAFLSSFSELQM